MEKWKPIEDFPDYVVSNYGRIRRIFKDRNNHRLKILTPLKNKSGYLYIRLYKNKEFENLRIHRLVLKAFDSKENSDKLQCNHKDGNKENNYIKNLEWCTASENIKHAIQTGLKIVTEKWKNGHSE